LRAEQAQERRPRTRSLRTSRERLAWHAVDACFAMAKQERHQSDGSLLTVV
jgi:hypothetical protein